MVSRVAGTVAVIDGATRVFALLGDPVAHSLSPAMQNAAFRALGSTRSTSPLRCDAADVAALMRALARAGGGGNVTVPHKEAAALARRPCRELAASRWAPATRSGRGRDASIGDNTDVPGVLAALGPARAAAGALADRGHRRRRPRRGRRGRGERGAAVAIRSRDRASAGGVRELGRGRGRARSPRRPSAGW